ncbi:lipid II flippase MurJ [Metabacillus idriensis]|uniref:lipid II flippase MurJ n=1 Tax=Metabacillus idriensis TaxID=324768 RepID=UPI003D2B5AC3
MIKKLYSYAGLIMLFALLSRLFGFFRELQISYYYGTTLSADMFYIVSSIPLVLYTSFAIAYSNAFLPNYHKSKDDEKDSFLFSSTVLIFLISIIVSMVMFLFPTFILKTIAPGIDKDIISQYVQAVRIVSIQVFFIGFNGLFNGLLNARGKYFIPSLFNMLFTLMVTLTLYILHSQTMNIVFWGITVVYVIQFLVQLALISKNLLNIDKYRINFSMIKIQFYETMYIFSGSSLSQVNYFIDRALASTIYIGALSTVNYVHKLNGFLIGLIGLLISNLLFPIISKKINEIDAREINEKNNVLQNIDKFVYIIMAVIIPITLILSIFSEEIVSRLFGNGEFSNKDVLNVSEAFSILILGTGFYILKDLYSYSLYAINKSKIVLMISLCSVLVNIFFNYILVNNYGVNGLMSASLISYIVAASISLWAINKHNLHLFSVRRHIILLVSLLVPLLIGIFL